MDASAAGGRTARHQSRRRGAWAGRLGALSAATLLALVPCATATAASPSPVQHKAYKVLLNALNGELAVTDKQVDEGATRVQQQLAPCLSALKASSMPQGPAQALGTELGVQYAVTSLRPLLEVAITEDTGAEQLPIRPKLRAALRTQVTQTTAVLGLDTCADVAAWQAAGFAPASEPSGTQLGNAYQNVSTADASNALYHLLSARQRLAIDPIRKKAGKHAQDLLTTMVAGVTIWLAQQGL